MADTTSSIDFLIKSLASRHPLDSADRAAIMALPYKRRSYDRMSYLLREGDGQHGFVRILISGFAYRHKIASNGMRQIVGMLLPGDAIDLQQLLLKRGDHNVQAASTVEVIEVNRGALKKLAFDRPAIGAAIVIDSHVNASILQEWLLNIGRRSAQSRVAHFLCEFATRMDGLGMGDNKQYELRLTQEHIADATGLTAVHVNRMLRSLVAEEAIAYEKPFLTVTDRKRLCSIAGFSAQYLHLDQAV